LQNYVRQVQAFLINEVYLRILPLAPKQYLVVCTDVQDRGDQADALVALAAVSFHTRLHSVRNY